MTLFQNNDETVQLPFVSGDAPYPIPGGTVIDFWIKPQSTTPDGDPSSVHLSTATGEVQITDAMNGIATVTIGHAHLAQSGLFWWRADAVVQGSRKTAGYGALQIQPV
jgi:hypothetical protein